MNRTKCGLWALIICILLFSSCKKSNSTIVIPPTPTTDISLKYSGGLYTCSSAVAFYNKTANVLQLGGVFSGNTYRASVNLIIPNAGVGTFDLSDGNASLTFINIANMEDSFISTSGSVTITQFTPTLLAGTFQFTGVDSLNVTRQISEGQFITSYTSSQ